MVRGQTVVSFSLPVQNVTGWMESTSFLVSQRCYVCIHIVLRALLNCLYVPMLIVLFTTVLGKVVDGLLIMRKIEVKIYSNIIY